MRGFIIVISVAFLSFGLTRMYYTPKVGSYIKIALEKAYFEGQKDALQGDWRVMLNSDSCYVWKRNPWDYGLSVEFEPKTCK